MEKGTKLEQFLTENDLLARFINNLNEGWDWKSFNEKYGNNPAAFLGAFTWSKTPKEEGHCFWREINDKYVSTFKQ